MKLQRLLTFAAVILLSIAGSHVTAQTTITIGSGSSSSSTRGPFQRADTNSTTVFSRFVQTYTAAELATAGLTSGASISSLNWELASSNVIIGSGNATLKVYIKNSAATAAVTDSWTNLITGSTLVVDDIYNTSNNFPGANGWMPFTFSTPFVYTGGALEIAVDWDCSQVSTPAFSGNGAIKFRWESTAPDNLVAKKTASSSAPSTISDLKDERANIQIVFTAGTLSCDDPTALNATNITSSTADLSWADSSGSASAFNWLVVDAGAGVMGTVVAGGTSGTTSATATGLTPSTMYDFYVASECGTDSSDYAGPFSFTTMAPFTATSPVTIGMGSSSSSTRGPFQRSDTASSTVFSRFVHVYTASELASAGITSGVSLTALNWELASSNVIIGNGDATLKIYIKNSSATAAMSDSWTNLIAGSTLAVDNSYNTTNNFPGANGWMSFDFSAPFVYTGGALEIAVDWDCSQVSTPAFSGDGSLKWRWESTAPDFLVVKKTASSGPSSTITDLKDERANIQFVFTSCPDTAATSITTAITDVACNGDNNGAITVTIDSGVPGYTFLWSNGDTTQDISGLTPGEYSVTITDGNGCTTTDSLAVTEPPALVVMVTSVSDTANAGKGAASISASGGTAPYTYTWNGSAGSADSTALAAGTYAITVTDANGCTDSASVTVDNTVSISDFDYVTSLSVSPNPTNGIAVIDLELSQRAEVEVEIYSVVGELIESFEESNTSQLSRQVDLTAYADGIYVVRLAVNEQTVTKKIVLMK